MSPRPSRTAGRQQELVDRLLPLPNRRPLSYRVCEQLIELMSHADIRPGDSLPSERVLADRLGVARGVIREAIRDLAARGFVTVRPGAGITVARGRASAAVEALRVVVDDAPAVTVRDVQELRRPVEIAAAELAAMHARVVAIARLRAALARHRRAHDVEEAAAADLEFHRIIAEMTGNPLFVAFQDGLRDVLLELRRVMMTMPGYVNEGLREHARILEAIEAGDGERARQEMAFHMENPDPAWFSERDLRGDAEATGHPGPAAGVAPSLGAAGSEGARIGSPRAVGGT